MSVANAAPDPTRVARDLERIFAASASCRPIDRLGRSGDASIYRLIPQAIVRPTDLGRGERPPRLGPARRRHLTFRAAGTSLSGQAVTDDMLVELAPHFGQARACSTGAGASGPQPGVVGGHLNRLLAPHGRPHRPRPRLDRRGDDRRHRQQQLLGHVRGVVQNSYHTLDAWR